MSSELIEKIKIFLFFDPVYHSFAVSQFRSFAECCPRRRDRGVGLYYKGVGEWIPGNT